MTGKILITILAVVSLTGCTTMRSMDTTRADLEAELQPDDRLVVYETSGRIIDMTFIDLEGETLYGRLTDGSQVPISVELSDIEKLEVEKIDGAKTTLAVVGGTLVLVPVALAAGLVGIMTGM